MQTFELNLDHDDSKLFANAAINRAQPSCPKPVERVVELGDKHAVTHIELIAASVGKLH
jgi:hypothetical protein